MSKQSRQRGGARVEFPNAQEQRKQGRLGKPEGITATAHKLARIIHSMSRSGRAYHEQETFKSNPGVARKREKNLNTLAKKMGFELGTITAQA